MTLAANTPTSHPARGLLDDLVHVLRAHLPRPRRTGAGEVAPSSEDAVVRALCHDMRPPLASLEAVLQSLGRSREVRDDLLDLARAQAEHLSSMLRTADASGGAVRHSPTERRLDDVVRASLAGSGLPRARLTVELAGDAADVAVADARVQRILINLFENAHRHGGGTPVRLRVARRDAWVDLALTQAGVPADRVVDHLRTTRPPTDLTGLGLWTVQRLTRELGGRVLWSEEGSEFTLTVRLPDR